MTSQCGVPDSHGLGQPRAWTGRQRVMGGGTRGPRGGSRSLLLVPPPGAQGGTASGLAGGLPHVETQGGRKPRQSGRVPSGGA